MGFKLTSLPSAQLLVRAAILGAGLGAAAAGVACAGGDDDTVAPTCGPCCHGSSDCDAGTDAGTMDAGPPDGGVVDAGLEDAQMPDGLAAPTCGPCCHGGPGCDGGV